MERGEYEKSADTRERILDVAEELFAKQGVEATTVRQITTAAGVRTASVNYYFDTKSDLAVSVVARRFDVLEQERAASLSAALEEAGSVRSIVEAFVEPAARLTRTGGAGWQHYNRIVATLALREEWPGHAYARAFDRQAQAFIDALVQTTGADPERAVVAFRLMLSTVLVAFVRTQRFKRNRGALRAEEPALAIDFMTAGVEAVLNR
ncbi:MAG: TetR/AcrR family transcriptional regulator [Sandaracinaceae bacterium]